MPIGVGGSVTAPPFAPVPISPANGQAVDLSGSVTFEWQFQAGTAGATQTTWYFRRKISGSSSYSWFNAGTNAWQSTEIGNSGSAQDHTFSAGKWTDGNTYNWSVATADSHGKGPYCQTATVIAQHGPSVVVTGPGGTITTSRPAIQWTPTVASGTTQVSYRVAIYTAAQYGASGFAPFTSTAVYDSGVVYGSAVAVRPPTSIQLANHTTYRAYVEITETHGMTSSAAYSAFTTSYTAPAAPNVVVRSGVTPLTTRPVNTVGIHIPSPIAGSKVTVQFSDDGGESWWTVRNGYVTAASKITVVDAEAPFGYTRHYRVVVQKTTPVTVISTPVVTFTQTAQTLNWWLSDPLTGATVMLHLAPGKLNAVSTDRQQVYPVLGRPDPVVLSDAFGLPKLSMTLVFLTDPAYRKFEAMRATQHVFLLQGPHPTGQWYVRFGATKTDATTLPSLRNWSTTGAIVRLVKIQGQVVAAP